MAETSFHLDIQGIRAPKSDKTLLNPETAALRVVINVCEPGAHTTVSAHFKPTRKVLNGFQHQIRLTAAPDSALRAALTAAVGGGPSEVTFAVHAFDAEQAKQLDAQSAADDLGTVLGTASLDLRAVLTANAELRRSEQKVDMLLNNAGVMGVLRYDTEDGWDVQLQVNHLGHFLLTHELLPLLKGALSKQSPRWPYPWQTREFVIDAEALRPAVAGNKRPRQ